MDQWIKRSYLVYTFSSIENELREGKERWISSFFFFFFFQGHVQTLLSIKSVNL